MSRRSIAGMLAGVALSACSSAMPTVEIGVESAVPSVEAVDSAPAGEPVPEVVQPPEMVINGQAGKPVSWCWGASCVDGFLHDPRLASAIAPPFDVELPPGSRIEGASAIGPGAPGAQKSLEVAFTETDVGPPPEGAIMLNVFVRFVDGGDASYYWALNRPPGPPVATQGGS